MARKSDKKERLVKAAQRLIYRKGFNHTSLADISQETGISLGNLYYYFKTKEDILAAVIEAQKEKFQGLTVEWAEDPDPRNRLASFLEYAISVSRNIAEYGCPVGSLTQEISKTADGCLDDVHNSLKLHVEWASEQFKLLGKEDAEALGWQFIANLQGVNLVANALNNSDRHVEQVERIKSWLKTV